MQCDVCLQPSVFELVRSPEFANLPLIVEDFIKDSGGSYTGGVSSKSIKGKIHFILNLFDLLSP